MQINFTPQEKQRIKNLALMFGSTMMLVDNVRVILPLAKWKLENDICL